MTIKDRRIFKLFSNSVTDFLGGECLKFSASLSYYTIFALPSFAIILITFLGYFIGEDVVAQELFKQINKMVGSQSAAQLQEIIKNSTFNRTNLLETTVGIITLVISATGMFGEVQSSINDIWKIKAKKKQGLKHIIVDQFFSFSMIGIFGFLLIVSLFLDSFLDILHRKIVVLYGSDTFFIANLMDSLFSFIIIIFLITYVFKELPDGKLRFKDAIVGAIFTALLFMGGKYLISLYLENSSKVSLYGTAGSILILLLWVYYSAIMLYFGAVFTKNYAQLFGKPIVPNAFASFKE